MLTLKDPRFAKNFREGYLIHENRSREEFALPHNTPISGYYTFREGWRLSIENLHRPLSRLWAELWKWGTPAEQERRRRDTIRSSLIKAVRKEVPENVHPVISNQDTELRDVLFASHEDALQYALALLNHPRLKTYYESDVKDCRRVTPTVSAACKEDKLELYRCRVEPNLTEAYAHYSRRDHLVKFSVRGSYKITKKTAETKLTKKLPDGRIRKVVEEVFVDKTYHTTGLEVVGVVRATRNVQMGFVRSLAAQSYASNDMIDYINLPDGTGGLEID